MAVRRMFLVREVEEGGQLAQRQTMLTFDDTTGEPIRPDELLGEVGRQEWWGVKDALVSVGMWGVVDGFRLLEHCLAVERSVVEAANDS